MAHWLCEHLDGINHPLVIDDLHDAAADPSIAAFVAKFAELRPTSSLTIALRRVGELPVPLWMATQRMERPIDEADLRFNDREVADIAQQFGLALDRNEIAALLARTHGSATAIVYAVTRQRRSPGAFSSAAAPSTFEDIAADIFARRSGHERALLFTTALYSSIDDELLAQNGWSNAPEIRSTMAEDAAFMWERDEAGILRFHDRFSRLSRAAVRSPRSRVPLDYREPRRPLPATRRPIRRRTRCRNTPTTPRGDGRTARRARVRDTRVRRNRCH
jgi:ATP/maltotriose-dependent transcriptional regulator MalT